MPPKREKYSTPLVYKIGRGVAGMAFTVAGWTGLFNEDPQPPVNTKKTPSKSASKRGKATQKTPPKSASKRGKAIRKSTEPSEEPGDFYPQQEDENPKIVAAGSSGCAYRPRMKCIEPDLERLAVNREATGLKLISKLCPRSEDRAPCREELLEVNKPVLRNSDPTNKYHIGGPILCTPDIGLNPEHTILRKPNDCPPATGHPNKDILIYEDGGTSLQKYIDKGSAGRNVSKVLYGFLNLFEGLSIMNTQNFYHRDIKPLNITVGTSKNPKYRFIDFGMAFTYPPEQKLPTGWVELDLQTYTYNYTWWPLDARILLPTKDKGSSIRDIINVWGVSVSQFLIHYYRQYGFDSQYYDTIDGLFTAMTNYMESLYRKRRQMQSEIIRKTDIFALGCSLYESVLPEIESRSLIGGHLEYFFHASKVLHIDSRIRPDATQFLAMYRTLIENLKTQGLI